MVSRAYRELCPIGILEAMQMLLIELDDLFVDLERGGDATGAEEVFELMRIVFYRER